MTDTVTPSACSNQVAQVLSVTPDAVAFFAATVAANPAARAARRQRREHAKASLWAAAVCAKCQGPIAPGEAIHRRGRLRANWCRKCGGRAASPWNVHSAVCPTCSRVVYTGRLTWPRHLYCSVRCQRRGQDAQRRAARAAAKGPRTCPVCDQTFTPARSDAQTCSPACRTRRYRTSRVTREERINDRHPLP